MTPSDRPDPGPADVYLRIKRLFLDLRDLEPAVRRERLDALPAADRERVEALLSQHDDARGPLESPPPVAADDDPETIGPYHVVRSLGRGGMGDVFLCEQSGALDRRVAVKRLRGAGEFRRRFEAERQVLARLQHPAIAQVFDAGADDDGTAWFAMEYVDGDRIDRWCATHDLDVRRRVGLVRDLCEGIAHAHLRGILHRDVKPGNVLVTDIDGTVRVKVIDFGVAKALQFDPTLASERTMVGQLIGTPDYMAPEQAELQPVLVDVRSDVYAIGVLLYELLTGVVPIETSSGTVSMTELRQRLLGEIPAPPSRHRQGLDRELDWICGKALAKDPTERYQSVASLADDLGRWERGDPIAAGPPTLVYRGRKFVARHRVAVVAASLVVLSLVVGLVGTSVGLQRAVRAEARARAEADRATEISDFLLGMFRDADPTLGGARDEVAEWVLRRGADALETLDDPGSRRRLGGTMGRVYRSLGLHQDAEGLLTEAFASLPDGAPATERARLQVDLGATAFGRTGYADADSILRSAAATLEGVSGEDARRLRAEVASWRGTVNERLGRKEVGHRQITLADSLYRTLDPLPWKELADNQRNLSVLLRRSDELEASLEAMDAALDLLETHGAQDDAVYASALHSRANLYENIGRHDEANADFERSRALWIEAFGRDHPHVASSLSSQSVVYYRMERYADMEAMASEALEIQTALDGPDHAQVAQHLTNRSIARMLQESGTVRRPTSIARGTSTSERSAAITAGSPMRSTTWRISTRTKAVSPKPRARIARSCGSGARRSARIIAPRCSAR